MQLQFAQAQLYIENRISKTKNICLHYSFSAVLLQNYRIEYDSIEMLSHIFLIAISTHKMRRMLNMLISFFRIVFQAGIIEKIDGTSVLYRTINRSKEKVIGTIQNISYITGFCTHGIEFVLELKPDILKASIRIDLQMSVELLTQIRFVVVLLLFFFFVSNGIQ